MRITSKGQVTIPQEVREKLGFYPMTEVEFVVKGESVRLVKIKGSKSRGKALVEHIRGKASAGLSTDEIMALTRG